MRQHNPSEDDLLDLDPDEVYDELTERLRSLPYPTYLRCLARFLREVRQIHDAHLNGTNLHDERQLVDRVVALAAAAADGRHIQPDALSLRQEWDDVTGFRPDEHGDVGVYDGPLDITLKKACDGVLWELSDEAGRFDGADLVAEGALDYQHPQLPAENTRLLLRFKSIIGLECRDADPPHAP